MKPQGFHMAWVVVDDFNQAKDFFTNVLGLTLTSEAPEYNWAEFSAGNGAQIGVGSNCGQSPIKAGSNAVICINVQDVVATKKELEEKGVDIIGDIQEVPGHVKMLLIRDKSGNYYHIVEMLN